MTAVAVSEVAGAVQVVIGVDTHQDEHVAVAIDQQGVRLAERYGLGTSKGYGELERWSRKLGEFRAFGVEGAGSYSARLARFLTGQTGTGRVRATHRCGDGSACGAGRSGECHSQVRRG